MVPRLLAISDAGERRGRTFETWLRQLDAAGVDAVAVARRAGADYVTFGPVFPTPSKARYRRPPGFEGLRRAVAYGLPVIALGGVGPGELPEAAAAGAAGMAGIRAFHDPRTLERWNHAMERGPLSWRSSD